MARRSTDKRKKSGPAAKPARKPASTLAMLTVTIPPALSDRAASFLGSAIADDQAFWMIALRTGIEELERQFREIEADAKREAEDAGTVVIFGSPVIIDRSPDDDDPDPDGIPF
ncbi:hypothetical protein [Shinella pollutisoli]|uniref:Uncharacterized protein n=1 Tax=Shinella pollutisoli TaxID=2250594 RepID=A0ABV7D9N5_9HYPH|nr:hypothetical protein [Shinella pollutisoli]